MYVWGVGNNASIFSDEDRLEEHPQKIVNQSKGSLKFESQFTCDVTCSKRCLVK